VSAIAEVATCQFDLDVAITIEMAGGARPGEIETTATGAGAIDKANRQIRVIVNGTAAIGGAGKQEMAMVNYAVGDWLYTKLALPETGGWWFKIRLTDEIWQRKNQLDQQIELMVTAAEVRSAGSEIVNGTDCYIIEVAPSTEALNEFLSQQTIPGTDIDWAGIRLEPLLEDTSIKLWIAKDTHLLMKSEIDMLVEIAAEDVVGGAEDFEKIALDMNVQTHLYGYDQPVTIELPEEALEAVEIPEK
jgi:hypothetical protein